MISPSATSPGLTTLDDNHRLLVPLKKWINIDSTPRLWYNATRKKVQRLMLGTWYESPLLLRRKSLELTYNWKVSTPVLKRIPLIEINNQ